MVKNSFHLMLKSLRKHPDLKSASFSSLFIWLSYDSPGQGMKKGMVKNLLPEETCFRKRLLESTM